MIYYNQKAGDRKGAEYESYRKIKVEHIDYRG
jgi:hypothetical protein